jgi:hypothetical protein
MMISKKGQGLSLNVIIIAALALIVLVVLVVIFTGRAGQTENQLEDISGESALKLTTMRLGYGNCAPGAGEEDRFASEFTAAESADEEQTAETDFKAEISRCKAFSGDDGESTCIANGCVWR